MGIFMANTNNTYSRQSWGTRLGVILAVAGSAVGLGNFLRFPSIATQNGGGAFLIPYFAAFLLLGIPLCWVEWTMGRYGGRYSHGSGPGILDAVSGRKPFAKYLGAIGVFGPLLIFFYYIYIESWTLGYAYYALTGKLSGISNQEHLIHFLKGYQGLEKNEFFTSLRPAYFFFFITFLLNFGIIYLGIAGGIERVSKIAMPLLALLGIVLAVRVLTLGTPDPTRPDWNVSNGLGFLWNPDFERLRDPKVWLSAAGQVFFTLSVGIGVILTYASYLKPKDDVALSGLTASATNEFMEVVIGASMVIPAAVVFFGATQAVQIAQSGTFNLGFVTMPFIFTKMPWGGLFCVLWFLLLFIAGVTSSISILQPAISFLEDEFHFSRRRTVLLTGLVCFLMAQLAIFGLHLGMVDEMDFWGGTFLLVVFALIEVIFFAWVFGMDKAWKEIHAGASIRIPVIFRFIIKYVTPLYILIMLGYFMYDNFKGVFLMQAYGNTWEALRPIVFLRALLLLLFLGICWMIHYAWKQHPKRTRPIP
jgi:SNF family Na+-dependent transporter